MTQRRRHLPRQTGPGPFRLVLLACALIGLLLGGAMPPVMAEAQAEDGVAICLTIPADAAPHDQHGHHHQADCALCPFCAGLAGKLADLATPAALRVAAFAGPASFGPAHHGMPAPSPPALAALPRGPPRAA
jgi:hypothetical protein